jgi:hypothetical protein
MRQGSDFYIIIRTCQAMKSYIFKLSMKVRDYECDLQGVVNNANYQHYLEHTRHEFLESLGENFGAMHEKGHRRLCFEGGYPIQKCASQRRYIYLLPEHREKRAPAAVYSGYLPRQRRCAWQLKEWLNRWW